FTDLEAAANFRRDLIDGGDLSEAAAARGGSVTEHGRVLPNTLGTELNTALFSTSAFAELPSSDLEVSDVIVLLTPVDDVEVPEEDADGDEAEGEEPDPAVTTGPTELETFVVLVAERTPARERPLEDVRAQITATVLANNRQALRAEWLAGLRDEIDVTEFTIVDLSPTTSLPSFEVPEIVDEDVLGEGDLAADGLSEDGLSGEDGAAEAPTDEGLSGEDLPGEDVADPSEGDEAP